MTKRGKTMRAALVATGFLTALISGAHAATVITSTQNFDGKPETQTMSLDGDRLSIMSAENHMLYRGDQGKVFIIQPKAHSYVEMSPESMAKVKSRMDEAMAQMKQRMAAMPEAQRQQMEKAMAGRMPGMGSAAPEAAPVLSFQKNGAPRKVGKWDCQPYTLISDGKPEADLCVARLSDLGLTRDDLKPLIGLSDFMGKQMAAMGNQQAASMASMKFDALTKAVGYDAFQIENDYKGMGDGEGLKTTVQSIEHKDLPAGSFDVPAGYTKRDMGGPR